MSEFAVAGHSAERQRYQDIGLYLGPLLAVLVWVLPVPEGMPEIAWQVVAVAALLATWWATEAIPVPITSLIPMVLFPLMGVFDMADTAAPYAHPIIYLLMGGFIIAMAMQRWSLHKRIALHILVRVGERPAALVAGFMISTALLSMWISNTATTLMMLPIALSVAASVAADIPKGRAFTVALLLSIPYASSIGGLGTLVGTPPNLIVKGYLEAEMGIEIGFMQWMAFGVPVVLVLLPLAWVILVKWCFPLQGIEGRKGREVIVTELKALGSMTVPEKRTAVVFAIIALSWAFRQLLDNIPLLNGLTDTGIAISGAIAMFLVPSGSKEEPGSFLLDWAWAVRIPWGVILLFGGGLTLAAAVSDSGLATWLGDRLVVLTTYHLFILMAALVTLVIFLTELTSNTATAAGLMPVIGAIALAGSYDPILLAAPAALAASCAFMLPVATAPNAIVFADGQVKIPDMVRAGFRLNIVGIVVISTLSYALVPWIFS